MVGRASSGRDDLPLARAAGRIVIVAWRGGDERDDRVERGLGVGAGAGLALAIVMASSALSAAARALARALLAVPARSTARRCPAGIGGAGGLVQLHIATDDLVIVGAQANPG